MAQPNPRLVKEKIAQVPGLLNELNIGLWLIFARETDILADPVMSLAVGAEVVAPSVFLYTRDGQAIAIINAYDEPDFARSGNFTEIITFSKGPGESLREVLNRLNPKTIAIDYSTDNPAADGLTHGMYLLLHEYLDGTPFADRLISAEEICSKLRSRKTPYEFANLEQAALIAVQAWDALLKKIKPGLTEIEIAGMLESEIKALGFPQSFGAIVNAGAKTQPGHGNPTDAILEPGDLLHIDFGAAVNGYCSDLQRLLYLRRPGETTSPAELQTAFTVIRDIIQTVAPLVKPGVLGHTVDTEARRILTENGYPEYQHGLGHQLGQFVHDGGALLGPRWEQYRNAPNIPLEANNVFTLELGIALEGIGYVGLEEDIVVTPKGALFLSRCQDELAVL